MSPKVPVPKKATEVSLPEALLSEARDFGANVSPAAEAGLAKTVSEKRAELWLKNNEDAIASSNAYVEKNGLPLEKFRPF